MLHLPLVSSHVVCVCAGKSELCQLAERYKEQFCSLNTLHQDVNLNDVADTLQVTRRRLYDIINVLEVRVVRAAQLLGTAVFFGDQTGQKSGDYYAVMCCTNMYPIPALNLTLACDFTRRAYRWSAGVAN